MLGWSFKVAAGQLAARLFRFRPLPAAWRVEMAGRVDVRGRVWLPGGGRVRIGRDVVLHGRRAPIELHAYEGGEIVLEDGAVVEDGVSIEATRSVRVGARARLATFCKIMDNNFHRTTGDRNERPQPVPVAIGACALVGPRAVLLPGAGLGEGAKLGPSQVLSFRLPPGEELPGPPGATEPLV
jgi:acetyltransferase-like isoleucine patch superfamily enzyme